MHDVRYKTNGDNRVLRQALCAVWGYRCYWCTEIKDFASLSIDHLIPKHLNGAKLEDALRDAGRPSSFDVHRSYNLAPICTSCNGSSEKGGRNYTNIPRFMRILEKAEKNAPDVDEYARNLENLSDPSLIKALDILSTKDFSSSGVRNHVAPVIESLWIQATRGLEHKRIPRITGRIEIQDATLEGPEGIVDYDFDGEESRAYITVEVLTGRNFDEVMCDTFGELLASLREDYEEATDGFDTWVDEVFPSKFNPPIIYERPAHPGPPTTGPARIELRGFEIDTGSDEIRFILVGSAQVSGSAHVMVDSEDGSQLDEEQLEFSTECTFQLAGEWAGFGDISWEVEIDTINTDIYPNN